MAPLANLIDTALGAGIQAASACARLKLPRFGLSACKPVELLSALREDSASWAIFKSIFMSWTRLISPFPRSGMGRSQCRYGPVGTLQTVATRARRLVARSIGPCAGD